MCSSIVTLKRYSYTHHYVTISQSPIGYNFELSYYLFVSQVPNTRPLYECITAVANFISLDLTCEGKGTYQRTSGYIYIDQSTNTNTFALYRCFISSKNDYFISTDINCEGTTKQGLLGYQVDQNNNPFACC